jgi:hypothetical protein
MTPNKNRCAVCSITCDTECSNFARRYVCIHGRAVASFACPRRATESQRWMSVDADLYYDPEEMMYWERRSAKKGERCKECEAYWEDVRAARLIEKRKRPDWHNTGDVSDTESVTV